jgi:23S rRNA pseudouridine1911/1915/1917 synthase
MVFAKTSKCASRLSEQVRTRTLKKTYYAVVCGKLLKNDTLKDYLLKDPKTNIVKVDKRGKEAILDYKVIDNKEELTLVKINLKTGRSHQIRVQFSSRGYALYGDNKYNKNAKVGEQIALFSNSISFLYLMYSITPKTVSFTIFF